MLMERLQKLSKNDRLTNVTLMGDYRARKAGMVSENTHSKISGVIPLKQMLGYVAGIDVGCFFVFNQLVNICD